MLESYKYPLIQGESIHSKDFVIARAKSIALAITNHQYVLSHEFRRRADNAEIILATLDIEIPQHSKNGVSENEDIAIIVYPTDNNFPEIYALRPDFEFGLPHTNTKDDERPISLCVTEQLFCEVRHSFIPFEFIELIRNWLKLTAKNTLHTDDQPLEPFFVPDGSIIYPVKKNFDINNFDIKPIKQPYLFRLEENSGGNGEYFCIGYKSDIQKTGFIRKRPQKISDLDEFILINGTLLSVKILTALNILKSNVDLRNVFLNKKIVIYCEIPIKRTDIDKTAESTERMFFISKNTIEEIGLNNSILTCTSIDENAITSEKEFDLQIVKNVEIGTYSIMYDFESIQAALYNNVECNSLHFTLIGAGALGSQILSLYARTGFGHWTVIDNDNLLPHNLARHALNRDAVGFNKAEKLSEELNILLDDKVFTPLNANFIDIAHYTSTLELLKKSTAIIDVSTSIAVARTLARDFQDSIATRRISAFLNPKGQDLVVLSEDKKREHRLDFLEMEYYRFIYENSDLNDHLKFENKSKVRYNRNSCREITSLINQADVLGLSAICAKTIRKNIGSGKAAISIWRTNPDDDSISCFSKEPSKWHCTKKDNWKIYMCDELLNRIQGIRSYKIESDGNKETGGVLLGCFDIERKIIYVFDTINAPSDSKESHISFERGVEGVITEFERYRLITDSQIQYLGEWHSHPKGCAPTPSSYDKQLYEYLYENLAKQGYPVLMAIFADKNYDLTFKSI